MTEEYDTAAAQSSWVSDACDYQLMITAGSTGTKTGIQSSNSLSTAEIIALAPIPTATGTNEFQSSELRFQVYPNPNNGIFTIQMAEGRRQKAEMKVEVYNVYGEKAYSLISSSPNSLINLSGKSKGIYFLFLETQTSKQVEKILVK